MIDDKYIYDKIDENDLSGLRNRNREIIKVWARLQGYQNIKFRFFLADEKNQHFVKNIISNLGEDFSNILNKTKNVIERFNSPIDLLIYREKTNEWRPIIIVDEFEIAIKSKRRNYKTALKFALSDLDPIIMFIGLDSSQNYIEKLQKTYTDRTEYIIKRKPLVEIGALYSIELNENKEANKDGINGKKEDEKTKEKNNLCDTCKHDETCKDKKGSDKTVECNKYKKV